MHKFMVANESPIKKSVSCSYSQAVITNGGRKLKVVRFNPSLRERLANCERTMDAVALSDCQVKRSKQFDDLEILLKGGNQVGSSPKKFSGTKIASLLDNAITLDSLYMKTDYKRVTVRAKVMKIDDPVRVSPKFQKYKATIADSTVVAKLTL